MNILVTIFSTLALLIAGFVGIKTLNNEQPFGASVLSVYQGGTGRSSFPAHMILTSASTTQGNLEASSTPQVGAFIATTTSASSANALATSTFWGGISIRQGTQIDDLVSCDTIDTDANGYLKCGSDGGGGGGGVDVSQKSKWATSTADATAIFTALAEKIGVGSSTPSTNLSIQGNALVAGTTTVKALRATSTSIFEKELIVNGTATSTFAGHIQLADDSRLKFGATGAFSLGYTTAHAVPVYVGNELDFADDVVTIYFATGRSALGPYTPFLQTNAAGTLTMRGTGDTSDILDLNFDDGIQLRTGTANFLTFSSSNLSGNNPTLRAQNNSGGFIGTTLQDYGATGNQLVQPMLAEFLDTTGVLRPTSTPSAERYFATSTSAVSQFLGKLTVSSTTPISGGMTFTVQGDALISGSTTVHALRATSTLVVDSGKTVFRDVDYLWPTADGTNGQILSTNANGVLSWAADATGGGGGFSNTVFMSRWATSTADATAIYTALAEKIGIASSTPRAALSVVGEAQVTGTTTTGGVRATTTIRLRDEEVQSWSGTGLSISGGVLNVPAGTCITANANDIAVTTNCTDAATVDSIEGASFLRSDASDSYTSGTLTFDAGTTLDLNTTTLLIADTAIAFDGASTDFTFTGNWTANTNQLNLIQATGLFGVGTATPSQLLSVQGDALIAGTTTVKSLLATSTIIIPNVSPYVPLIIGTSNGLLGVNATSKGIIDIGQSSDNSGMTLHAHGSGNVPVVNSFHSNGTNEAPTATLEGDDLFFLGARGYTGTSYGSASRVAFLFEAGQNWGGADQATKLSISTTEYDSGTRIDRFNIDKFGNVGFGATTTPWGQVAIEQTAATTSGNVFIVADNGTTSPHFLINGSGQTGIGTTTSTKQKQILSVHGSSLLAGSTTVQALTATGTVIFSNIPSATAVINQVCIDTNGSLSQEANCTLSSMRYKEDIFDQGNALSTVMALRPRRFKYKNDDTHSERLGFIAEEVEQVDKRFVNYNKEGLPNSVRYEEMVSLLTKAMQEQQNKIEELEARIKVLEQN